MLGGVRRVPDGDRDLRPEVPAKGFAIVFVSGVVISKDGECSGELPGKVRRFVKR
jgi:hypothetical protein